MSSDVIESTGSRIEAIEASSSEIGLRARAKVKTRPSIVYEILTDPKSLHIFRNMKACTYRKTIEEDKKKGTRKLEVAHEAIARFLWISVTFETRLLVEEDDKRRQIRFRNADDKGVMKRFEGLWDLREWSESAYRSPTLPSVVPAPPPSLLSFKDSIADVLRSSGLLKAESVLNNLSNQWSGGQGTATLATLEQTVQPRSIPPGMKGLIRRLCAAQVTCMLEDLNAEVDRREGRVQKKGQGKAAIKKGAAAASLSLSPSLEAFLKPLQTDEALINIKIKI